MRIRWFGQSAFLLTGSVRVAIDPFGDVQAAAAQRGIQFSYPPISEVADLLLITHEHFDHNGADAIGGDPQVIRSTAGTFDSPVGEVRAIASEHDDVAGTQRGPNSIITFALDGLRLCHFGDFGQAALRPEQRAAIGAVDVLMLPVGGGPTVGGEAAAKLVRELAPKVVIPCTTAPRRSTSSIRRTRSSPLATAPTSAGSTAPRSRSTSCSARVRSRSSHS